MASLHFVYGPMNSAKTTSLIQAAYNYTELGSNVLILKPNIDNREGTDSIIKSRVGLTQPCRLIASNENLYELVLEEITGTSFKDRDDAMQAFRNMLEKPLASYIVKEIACVFIDEVQFVTEEQVGQLSDIVDGLGIPVMAFGLRNDFQGNPFPASKMLMAVADELRESRGICWCGRRSNHVLRIDDNGTPVREGAQISVGGNDRYVSVCRKHHKLGQIKK